MSDNTLIPRYCAACKNLLKGRHDKKFCNDACRNNHNNLLKSIGNKYVRKINNALAKNRRILKNILPDGKDTARIKEDALVRLGFQFKYFTHTYTNKNEKTYYYCYDYGYLPLETNWYLVVRENEE